MNLEDAVWRQACQEDWNNFSLLISNESDAVNNSLKLTMNKKEAPGSAEAELL